MTLTVLVAASVLLGLVTGQLAARRGRGFWGWAAYGALLAPIGLVHILLEPAEV